jgi:hypothetical protein
MTVSTLPLLQNMYTCRILGTFMSLHVITLPSYSSSSSQADTAMLRLYRPIGRCGYKRINIAFGYKRVSSQHLQVRSSKIHRWRSFWYQGFATNLQCNNQHCGIVKIQVSQISGVRARKSSARSEGNTTSTSERDKHNFGGCSSRLVRSGRFAK